MSASHTCPICGMPLDLALSYRVLANQQAVHEDCFYRDNPEDLRPLHDSMSPRMADAWERWAESVIEQIGEEA